MTEFEREFFKQLDMTLEEIRRTLESALHDRDIAEKDPFPEVLFSYSFQALIKAGMALIAKTGKVKVRSIPGHHAKILAKMAEILKDPDILTMGNAMRMRRNLDLYGGGYPISEKEASDYLDFTKGVIQKVRHFIP